MKAINVCIDKLVKNSGGRFFSVTFKNKAGDTRKVVGKVGVGGLPIRYDSETTGGKYLLISDYMDNGTPKRVNLRTIERIAMDGSVLYVAK